MIAGAMDVGRVPGADNVLVAKLLHFVLKITSSLHFVTYLTRAEGTIE